MSNATSPRNALLVVLAIIFSPLLIALAVIVQLIGGALKGKR